MSKLIFRISFLAAFVILSSCGGDSSPGYEYMPNMYRSPGIETYAEHSIDGYNGMPVEGTVSRGNLSTFNYDGTLEGYLEAGKKATYPDYISRNEQTLKEGENLFQMMCAHCHGSNGDGKGSITHPVYSIIPSYQDSDPKNLRRSGTTMIDLQEGHIFHAITYGINAMGPHASQLTEEERWKIVFYIKEKLQNTDSK